NGVLIYLAVDDHQLAIAGDAAVHARVGDECWQRIRDAMVERLRRGEARAAVVHAVAEVGEILRRFFPRRPDDRNELSDQVSLS
ncbi:MAG: TPM domain-containing protein, partial [Candidatus Rokuibacteriota bacterium]